jgi:hypothetical protein
LKRGASPSRAFYRRAAVSHAYLKRCFTVLNAYAKRNAPKDSASKTKAFAPETKGFASKTKVFAPETKDFAPKTKVFASETKDFALETKAFASKTKAFDLDTKVSDLKTVVFASETKAFDLDAKVSASKTLPSALETVLSISETAAFHSASLDAIPQFSDRSQKSVNNTPLGGENASFGINKEI